MHSEPMPPGGSGPAGEDPAEALRVLRREVAELQADVRRLRGEVARLGGDAPWAPAPAVAPASERRQGARDRRRPHWRDLEGLVGRYGTVALGALLLLMGAGVLLSWAVQRIQFGPVARVSLGALGAAIVAAVGVRVRARGARSFGSTLLGIALALVHVDAWGAGPSLQVIPNAAALGIAALASAALAALAWRSDDEALFVIGVGGAFLAPFVTADKHSNVLTLLVYGWVVLAAATVAIRGREWRWATWLLASAATAYTVAAMTADWTGATRAVRDAPAAFAIACAATAFLGAAPPASRLLARICVWVSALALTERALRPEHAGDVAVLAAAGSLIAWLASRRDADRATRRAEWLATIIAAPLALLAIVVALPTPEFSIARAALAAAWSAAALLAAWDVLDLRDGYLFVGGAASAYAVVALVRATLGAAWGVDAQLLTVGLLAAQAAAFGALARRTREPLRLVAPAVVLLLASLLAYRLLVMRTAYSYPPFLTLASLAALGAVAGWSLLALHARTMEPIEVAGPFQPVAVVTGAAALAAFLFGRAELARAFSPEIAVFLLVLYFAAAGVGAIFAGRVWALAGARRAGLAVAVYAALKALAQVSDLQNVGLRIGAYVLVGSFLLAVAFWYRAAGVEGEPGEQPQALDGGHAAEAPSHA